MGTRTCATMSFYRKLDTFTPPVFRPKDGVRAREFFQRNSYSVFQIIDDEDINKELIATQIECILEDTPWGFPPTAGKTRDEKLALVHNKKLTIPEKQDIKAHMMHGAFGAPAAGHFLTPVWNIRRSNAMLLVNEAITGAPGGWHPCMNRTFFRCDATAEFLHLDTAPGRLSGNGISGKYCATESSLIVVPGTHTQAFHDEFIKQYTPFYPNTLTPHCNKFALDPNLPDPMNLAKQVVRIKLRPGQVILWDENAFHGVGGEIQGVECGFYNGFLKSVRRPEYSAKAIAALAAEVKMYMFDIHHLEKNLGKTALYYRILQLDGHKILKDYPSYGSEYLKLKNHLSSHLVKKLSDSVPLSTHIATLVEPFDRLVTYLFNLRPLLWPSLDKTWYFPYKWINYPKMMANMIARIPEDVRHLHVMNRMQTNGNLTPIIQEYQPCIDARNHYPLPPSGGDRDLFMYQLMGSPALN